MEKNPEVEKSWEFWKDIVCHPDGSINLEQLKLELHDFYRAMQEVPKVYEHVTGGQLSKILYKAETVISAADEYYEEHYRDEFNTKD